MAAVDLRTVRKQLGWSQQELASRLQVSQGLVSLWEHGVRKFPAERMAQLQELGAELDPLALPLKESCGLVDFAQELANLGYPGFEHFRTGKPGCNPAQLLVLALSEEHLDQRTAEALPWLVLRFSEMNWEWVRSEVKLRDLQNRLGFTLALARKLAEQRGASAGAAELEAQERLLRGSLLAKEDTYCNNRMTSTERKWLETSRSPEAASWHVLSDLRTEHLSHA